MKTNPETLNPHPQLANATPESLIAQLGPIGWRPVFQKSLHHVPPGCHLARVVSVHRETVHLHDGLGVRSARLHPKAICSDAQDAKTVAVGDWVLAQADAHGNDWVLQLLEPTSRIRRLDGEGAGHTVVSNIDTLFVVMGLDADFNISRAERYLLIAHAAGVQAVLVLTKLDVCRDADTRLDALRQRLGRLLDIQMVNACDLATCAALRDHLGLGQTVALMGSSGAGKSTLTNTLLGRQAQSTGAVRTGEQLQGMGGKHTTTARTLFVVPGGGCIIDTPGLRTLRVDGGAQAVAAGFEDIALNAAQCKFRNCTHGGEPGCAVREVVDPARLKNFQKLLRDAERDTLTVLDKKAAIQGWKARSRQAKLSQSLRGKHG